MRSIACLVLVACATTGRPLTHPPPPPATQPVTVLTPPPAPPPPDPCAHLPPQGNDKAPDKIDRLVALAQIWSVVKFFHPVLWQRPIDWDGALVAAIPEVEAATDATGACRALQKMLAVVGDPVTAIVPLPAPRPASEPAKTARSWAADGVLVLDVSAFGGDYATVLKAAGDAQPDLAKAKVAVLDLRGGAGGGWADLVASTLKSWLPPVTATPLMRRIQHTGWRTQGGGSTMYSSSWLIQGTGSPTDSKGGPAHVVLVGDENLPPWAVAMWLSGHATIVSASPLSLAQVSEWQDLPTLFGLVARVRTSEMILPGGAGFAVDRVAADPLAAAITIAKDVAAGQPPPHAAASRATTDDTLRIVNDDTYADAPYPTREHRLLAGIRMWSVITYFYPYLHLDDGWNQALRDALPRLDAATDAASYQRALRMMGEELHDGHVSIFGGSVPPRMPTPVIWRRVEGKIIAFGFTDPGAAKKAGVLLGDELVSVDGKAVADLYADALPATSGGTEEAREQRAISRLDAGPLDQPVTVVVKRGNANVTLTLARTDDLTHWTGRFSDASYRLLSPDLGYADLGMLTVPEVDQMFDAFAKTKAIILDMRAYPKGTAWSIAPHLNAKHAKIGAQFNEPLVTWGGGASLHSEQPLASSEKPYTGKVFVLIDDRAISQAEHSCLFFEVEGATFVGSPTHGSNGDVTSMLLPGGLQMMFTGLEVLHADGRQLQQVGIQPTVLVRPTIAGVTAGRDEVLERAIQLAHGK